MNFSKTERSPEKLITVSQHDRKSPRWNQAIEMNVILIFETSVKLRALNYDSQLILGEILMRCFLSTVYMRLSVGDREAGVKNMG